MGITVDTIQLKFNVTPSYQQQQILQLNADLKQATANYESLGKAAKDNAKEHSRLYGELSKLKAKRDELTKQKTLTEKQQQDLAAYNNKIEDLTDSLVKNEEQRDQLTKTESLARKEMVELQNKMNGVTQSTLRYNMTIQQLGERERELRTLLNNIDPSTVEWEKYNRELSETKKRIADLRRQAPDFHGELKLEEMTIKQLNERIEALRTALNDCKPNTPEFKEYSDALIETESQLKKVEEEINNTKVSFGKFIEGFNKFAWAIQFAYQGMQKIVSWADQYVQSFAKMDDAMTDVMKYTGQTKAEVEEMNETFKQMTTRTPREELNALAGAAGRLGIQGKKDIEGFVDAADKINVALGDDLGEGAIDQIGKLTMVFGEDKTKGLNGAMLATGSAINVLGANSSANTGFITEFTSSMAGMAVNAKISQADIMGYASALSQAGIEGQTASGVFAQMITKMFTDPAKFARAAKLDVKAFTDLLKTDANAAILQFLEGLKSNGGFDSLAPALKSLSMQGTQAVPVISSLINKMDELKKAQSDARQAYDEGTSIIEEFNNANSSAAAKLEISKKALNDMSAELGQKLMPIVQGSITASTTFLEVLSAIVGFIVPNTKALVQLTIAIAAYTIAVNAASISISKFVVSAKNALMATRQWFATLTANPIGLAAAALTLFVGEIINYVNRARKAAEIQEDMNEAMREAKKEIASERNEMDQLIGTVKSATSSENERREALEKLNGKLMGLHLGNLTEEQIRTGDLTTVLDAYNKKLETSIKLKRLQAQQEDLINQKIDLEEGGYKDDISFGDRIAQGFAATGQALISGHLQGFRTAFNQEWDRVDESFKNRALRPILEGLNTVEDKIAQIKSDEEKAANTISYVGEVVVTPGAKGDGNSSSSKSDKELKKEQSERERQRKELEAQAKAAYEKEKIELRQQYQGKKQLQEEWHQKEFSAEQDYIAKLLQIRKDYGAKESEMMEAVNMKLDADAKEANYREELRKRNQQEALRRIDQQQGAEEIALAQQKLSGEIATQEEFDRKKLETEIKYQKLRLEALTQGSDEYRAAQRRLLSLELQEKQQQQKEQEQFTSSYQNTNNSLLHDHFSQADSWQAMLDLNDEYRQKDLISEQQYQQNRTEIERAAAEERQAIEQASYEAIGGLLQSASQLFSAMQQRETQQVDAKYKKLIASAKKQGKDTTKLEEQMQAEKDAIAKKYAQKQFAVQVLQIIASTATGIARLWADLPFYAALPLTAVVAASGAMQLASAKAAADQAAGLYEGGYSDDYQEGYTKKGNPREQAGVIPVHKNEFVANHKAVANPEVRPVLDVIDRHQKAGDIQMLNSTRMLEEAYGGGRYRGGYTNGSNGYQSDSQDGGDHQLRLTDEDRQLLREIARNTGTSLTVRGLRDEIRHQERLEQNASR